MKYLVFTLLSLVFALNTALSQTVVVLNEDFESAPYDLSSSGGTTWASNSRLQVSGLYCDSCNMGAGTTTYLTTNSFSTAGNTSVLLEFKQICKIENVDVAQLEYSIDGGTTWNVITNTYYLGSGAFATNKFGEGSYPTDWQNGTGAAIPQNSWWKTELFDLGTLLGNQANVQIRFKLFDFNNIGPTVD